MKIGLFKGRHELPVKNFIFEETVNPTDLVGMRTQIHEKLKNAASVKLYVTGLTVATTEVVSYCIGNIIPITLLHYDRDTDSYFKQIVLSEQQATILKYDCGLNSL
ncbi:hypothetical protein [Peptostreptococcus sp. D1]|uniref:hypothetical protein n=1 Tax=Peptostreptococcus sp. D1 TaxID=72304 RepID=UPI0008E16E4A|nr:hypothetical protein [Peptostreptococcus sp. D1]SFE89389.1 hypothetical protein SAMN02910278_01981 [Peptostreptococcus sp. D1]